MSPMRSDYFAVPVRRKAHRHARRVFVATVVLAGMLLPTACTSAPEVEETGNTTTVEVHIVDAFYVPDSIDVPTGDRLVIELINDHGDLHDLELSNGAKTGRFGFERSETLDVGIISGDLDGWCTIPPHREQGMVMTVNAID